MKTWTRHLKDIAAGMLFNGGYVATVPRDLERRPCECAGPATAGEPAAATKDASRRGVARPCPTPATN